MPPNVYQKMASPPQTAIVRKITRDINEDARGRVGALANTEAFQQSRRERKKDRDAICAYEAHSQGLFSLGQAINYGAN